MRKFWLKHFSSYSLLTKLLLALIVLTTAIIGPVGYSLFNILQKNASAQLEAHATQMVNLLSRALAVPLWNIDQQSLQDQLDAIMAADRQVFSVVLYSASSDSLKSAEFSGAFTHVC